MSAAVATSPRVLSPYASEGFNTRFLMELQCLGKDVVEALAGDLIAIVLGGGFGRGEGCVVTVDGVEMPYNDVDLFLVTKTASPRGLKKLAHIAQRYEHRLGIAVDFSRPQTPAMISKWEPLLMWQELVKEHVVLMGPQDILTANAPDAVLAPLPALEASRMMLNRGAGLLWSARVCGGLEASPDSSFVQRNFYKCCQAFGDAVLISAQRYVSHPDEKLSVLKELAPTVPWLPGLDLLDRFEAAMAFRRDPSHDSALSPDDVTALAAAWLALFLWLENNRLGRRFESMEDYLHWNGLRETQKRNMAVSFAANLRRWRLSMRHPREAVYRALPQALRAFCNVDKNFPDVSKIALQRWREAA